MKCVHLQEIVKILQNISLIFELSQVSALMKHTVYEDFPIHKANKSPIFPRIRPT